jgi:hypothetical protein
MRTIASFGVCVAVASGCASAMPPPDAARSVLVVEGEGAGGLTTRGQPVSRFSGGAGFEMSGCCGAGAYIARSYVGGDTDPNRIANTEITEIGGNFTVAPFPRWRLRLNGGLAATPPKDQELGRRGVAGSGAVFFRVVGPEFVQVGSAAPRFEVFADYTAFALGRQLTSAGWESEALTANTVLLGARLSIDYGLDLR